MWSFCLSHMVVIPPQVFFDLLTLLADEKKKRKDVFIDVLVGLPFNNKILCLLGNTYCKSRIFRMHVIFVYFVRSGFCTKIKCMRKVQSKSENPQWSATVRKVHAYESSESPGYENWVRTKYSGFTVIKLPTAKLDRVLFGFKFFNQVCYFSSPFDHIQTSEVCNSPYQPYWKKLQTSRFVIFTLQTWRLVSF